MALLVPFRALRPTPERAAQVAAVPYDVVSTEEARALGAMGLKVYATPGTADILRAESIACEALDKHDGATEAMRRGAIDLVINIPREYDEQGRPDGARIRRAAIDLEIPLITDLWLARKLVRAVVSRELGDLRVKSWHHYLYPVAAETKAATTVIGRRS